VHSSLRYLASGALALHLLASSSPVRAGDVLPHASAGAALAVSEPQSREFGLGGRLSGGVEYRVIPVVGFDFTLAGMVLSSGDPPVNPKYEPKGAGTVLTAFPGVRLHPFKDAWLSAAAGLTLTGNLARFGLGLDLGYDFPLGPKVMLGPTLGYLQVIQGDSTLRPEDARILHAGLQFSLAPSPRDRDGDGIVDGEDACPDEAGIRTNNPKTNGCPRRDRDADTIFDDEDACPHEKGVRTNDPKTNGCPKSDQDRDGIDDDEDACPTEPGFRNPNPKLNGCPARDRDKDGVGDSEDACPDNAGVRTEDPKTNGCPKSDRDADTVYDDEDACPDIAGVRTTDPKTNGCPPPEGNIRIEGERIVLDDVILFDLDSPRVRRASWPVVERIAKFISKTDEVLEVSIEGHSDAVGAEDNNQKLSEARAESVRVLLLKYGVPEDRVKAEAFGRSRLRVQTARAERMNRRVEFWVTRTKSRSGQ
jgi:OmpA-OmpF porin, OOP family